LKDSSIFLEDFRLDGGKELTLVNGTLSFGRTLELAIETTARARAKTLKRVTTAFGHVLKISVRSMGQKFREKSGVRQPAD